MATLKPVTLAVDIDTNELVVLVLESESFTKKEYKHIGTVKLSKDEDK